MFADPNVALMAMLMLFFFGMICVFFFLMRAIGLTRSEMRDAQRRQQQVLTDLEAQIMELSFSARGAREERPVAAPAQPAPSPKSGLSFLDADDSILALLDGPAHSAALSSPPPPEPEPIIPNFEDKLFTRSPAPGRTILDDLDLPAGATGRAEAPSGARQRVAPAKRSHSL